MLENLPLHPAIVHLPLGILFLLPIVTVFMALLFYKGVIQRPSFLTLVLLQVLLVGASYAALETGEDEEHVVEKLVDERTIESHEEKAETFMIGTIVVLVLSLGLVLPGAGAFLKSALAGLLIAQLGLILLGYRVGHSGGELVYVHGAAGAYKAESDSSGAVPKGSYKTRNHEGHDDD